MNFQLVIDSFIGPWAYSKQYVRNALKDYEGKHVDVLISSPGGSVDHGFDIMNQFRNHGDVTVYLSGLVASAGTIIAMGAKRIVMTKASAFMIHKCSNYLDIWGSYNADQIQKLIEELEQNKKDNERIDLVIANIYAEKSKKQVADILPILKKGGWMTPDEVLDLGLVDEISDTVFVDQKVDLSPSALTKLNALGTSTDGLTPERFNFFDTDKTFLSIGDVTPFPTNPLQNTEMKTFNFTTVEALLKLDAIQVDNDGYVAVTAENFEKLNDRIKDLEDDLKKKNEAVAAKDDEIAKLKDQIKNLSEAPGDETEDIEDLGDEAPDLSAHNLYNNIKNIL